MHWWNKSTRDKPGRLSHVFIARWQKDARLVVSCDGCCEWKFQLSLHVHGLVVFILDCGWLAAASCTRVETGRQWEESVQSEVGAGCCLRSGIRASRRKPWPTSQSRGSSGNSKKFSKVKRCGVIADSITAALEATFCWNCFFCFSFLSFLLTVGVRSLKTMLELPKIKQTHLCKRQVVLWARP